MASEPDGFDLESLLKPISEQAPAGEDLRADISAKSLYFRLRDARAEARAAERVSDAEGGDDPPPVQWRTISSLAVQALSGRTKDLEIAAWFVEALVRSDGLLGLSAGARLLKGLVSQYWETGLYPTADEDGPPGRVAPISGLNGESNDGTLIQPLRKIQLCARPTGEPLYYYQYEDAATTSGIADAARRNARIEAGSLQFSDVENWAAAAGKPHFSDLRRQVRAAIAAWEELSEELEEKAGADSPPTRRVKDLLNDIAVTIERFAPVEEKAPPVDAGAAPKASAEPTGQPTGEAAFVATSALRSDTAATREDMLRELARIADWFRKTEPQSPLSYTLDDAVRRARMALPDLLNELVTDTGSRHAILSMLGIRPPSDPSSE